MTKNAIFAIFAFTGLIHENAKKSKKKCEKKNAEGRPFLTFRQIFFKKNFVKNFFKIFLKIFLQKKFL